MLENSPTVVRQNKFQHVQQCLIVFRIDQHSATVVVTRTEFPLQDVLGAVHARQAVVQTVFTEQWCWVVADSREDVVREPQPFTVPLEVFRKTVVYFHRRQMCWRLGETHYRQLI